MKLNKLSNLHDIATQTPYEGGKAMYQARLMIGYDVDEHEVGYRLQATNNQENSNIQLYPNPTTDKVTIEILNAEANTSGILKIYSTTGKLLYENNFSTENGTAEAVLNDLQNGVYVFECILNTNERKTGRLVIIK